MFEKHLWKSDILSKDVTLPQVFFKHFASKNQLPGFYISRTLVENGLNLINALLEMTVSFLILSLQIALFCFRYSYFYFFIYSDHIYLFTQVWNLNSSFQLFKTFVFIIDIYKFTNLSFHVTTSIKQSSLRINTNGRLVRP